MSTTAIKESADAVVEQLSNALTQAQEARDQAVALLAEDPLPMEFIGILRGYRYGKDNGHTDGIPGHCFEVDCGKGLWLHVKPPSDVFDQFIKDSPIAVLESGDMLNGKGVLVRRDPSTNVMLPVSLLGDVVGSDSEGLPLFVGSRLTFFDDNPGEEWSLIRGSGTSSEGRELAVCRSRQNSEEINKYLDRSTRIG